MMTASIAFSIAQAGPRPAISRARTGADTDTRRPSVTHSGGTSTSAIPALLALAGAAGPPQLAATRMRRPNRAAFFSVTTMNRLWRL